MIEKNEQYRSFKQLINSFNYIRNNEEEEKRKDILPHTIKLEPKLIYDTYNKDLKIEFKLGNKNMYTLKNLVSFYDNMFNKVYYQYGSKLEFKHTKEAFEQDSQQLLDYLLKYAELIKYTNESARKYVLWGTYLSDKYITVSNTGIDELFDILKGKSVVWSRDGKESTLYFEENKPDIKFHVEMAEEGNYKIYPNIDIYEYEILQGKEYTYLLMENILYRCTKEFKEKELKIIEIFRKNFEKEIIFSEKELPQLFSLVFPKIKGSMEIDKLNQEEIEKYIPEDLYVKVYLDYDKQNNITSDIKFVYGEKEFNPLLNEKIEIARDIIKEDEVLELFRKVGFMLDIKNRRLILANDEAIYNFLSIEVEEFMQKFEVLATDSFKQKEIREPRIGSLGVKIENDLLKVDFSNINFDINELKDIMSKYKLKKKYHRLKDGSFLKLEENDTINFIDGITSQIEIDFAQIKEGELKLPIYRSMYLDRLLENIKTTAIHKDKSYKNIVNVIEEKQSNNFNLPVGLDANLREYQKVGFEWLKVLDQYKFGGILADDMGLGKTIQLIAVILSYVQENENAKPSIVICPSSLSLNWQNEINKFAPELKSIVISGGLQERKNRIKSINDYNIIITSYDLLKRDIDFYEEQNYEFRYIIADEAQYIKNNNTQNAKAIKKINAQTRFALTGTPIENSLSELWSIFDYIMPGYLFSYKRFKEIYELPIVKDEDKQAMRKLKMLIEPFILRRVKSEVLTELPDKTITVINNEMRRRTRKNIYVLFARCKTRSNG